jgi:spore germination protein YaaH
MSIASLLTGGAIYVYGSLEDERWEKMKRKIAYICLLVIGIVLGSIYFVQNFYFVSKSASTVPTIPKVIIYHDQSVKTSEDYGDGVRIRGEAHNLYVALDLLQEELDVYGEYDTMTKVGTITTKDKVIRFYGEDGQVKVNNRTDIDALPVIIEDDRVYVPIQDIEEYIGIKSRWIEERNSVVLINQKEDLSMGEVIKDQVRVREDSKLLSSVLEILEQGDQIQFVEGHDQWVQVMTENGQVGYVDSNAIGNKEMVEAMEIGSNEPIWKPEKGKIFLTWDHIHNKNPDTEKIGPMEGVNVISPTWISIVDGKGTIKHNIDRSYIDWAKARGYKVWALANNSFDPDMTNTILNNSLIREKIINELVKLAVDYDLDGINIDFENVYMKDRDKLTQFVREVTPMLHEKDRVVSIDVTIKSMTENWSLCYDRKALGEIVDYMAVMTYDEHWSSSPVSGSVASIGWVEKGMAEITEEVPAEKLLLGVPFYTRIWTESPSTDDPSKTMVKSKAVGMETINEILKIPTIQKEWLAEVGQYYVSYEKDGKLQKIWIEDSRSLQLKAGLVEKHNFAGVAAWRRGFETPEIWSAIDQIINFNE